LAAVNDQSGRDEKGRLTKGHKLGGRPMGRRSPSPVSRAFAAAGLSIEEARKLVAEKAVEAVRSGDPKALRLVSSWLFPKERPLDPGLFRGTRTPEDRAAAVLGAVATGAISPAEAVDIGKSVRELAEAGEWEDLRRVHEATMTARTTEKTISLPAGPDDGPGTPK
jgi:hypothetical protein